MTVARFGGRRTHRMLRTNMTRLALLIFSIGAAATAFAAEPSADSTADELRFFESRIRPLLANHCWECHGEDDASGGLRLDSHSAAMRGGDSGTVIQPGKSDESLLVAAVRYEDLEMPPEGKLSEREIADLQRWIDRGAFWPKSEADAATVQEMESGSWWAAEPLAFDVPAINGEFATPIDRFLVRRLREEDLAYSPPADRATLVRRLYYDLLGLPPTPEEIDAFVHDSRPDAYPRLVDRLLASPGYGERWGRHWLDVVRFAESDGWRADAFRPDAWRYRDWVIEALNEDLPYEQFVAYQLAGDELAPNDPEALAAAGFLRLGIYEYNQRDAEDQWQSIQFEMTDVAADVFLATGMACAKCHDHKFDPIPRADYFRFLACFEPVLWTNVEIQPEYDPETADRLAELQRERQQLEAETRKKLGDPAVEKFPLNVQAMFNKPFAERDSYEHQISYLVQQQVEWEYLKLDDRLKNSLSEEELARWEEINREIEALTGDREPTRVMTVYDAAGPTRPTRLPGRTQGRAFEPGVPQVFGGEPLQSAEGVTSHESTGRRLALARWITSPDNPIAARVIVNRIWQHHFGTGLVASANDFGRLGELPSHPELLDYLAAEFLRSGGSMKSIHRMIVLSDAYRQSSQSPSASESMPVDSANRLLWHFPLRRLDAEQYRDALLVVGDMLRSEVGGPSPSGVPSRRTVYLRRMRNSPDEMLRLLDAPPSLVSTARRSVTTTATQSLMLLNSERILGVANQFAVRLQREGYVEADAFIRRAYRVATGHQPPDELVQQLSPLVSASDQGRRDFCLALLNSNAFLFVD